jgi:hypothetical protein
LALELEKQLAIEAKKKEAERKSTLEKILESPLLVVHAADQAAKMVGANRYEAKLFSILADHLSRRTEKLRQGLEQTFKN